MSRPIIAYTKDLPEIPDRRAWEPPTSYLVKDASETTGWREDKSGRRPSDQMLVDKVRAEVDAWRDHGYDGASDVTKSLFEFWFEQDHDVSGFPIPFRYYFGQREAIETLVYLVEVLGNRDAQPLIERFATVTPSLLQSEIRFQTTADGQRQVVRPSPTQPTGMVLSLPPIDLRRYATKMATGSGQT